MPMIDEYQYVKTDKGLDDFIAKLNLAGSKGWRPIWQNYEGSEETGIYFCFIFRKYSTKAREREAQKFWEKKQEEEKKKQEAKFKEELGEMGKELKEEEEKEEAEEEKKRTVRAVFKDGKRVE
jgi:hypothetical protein